MFPQGNPAQLLPLYDPYTLAIIGEVYAPQVFYQAVPESGHPTLHPQMYQLIPFVIAYPVPSPSLPMTFQESSLVSQFQAMTIQYSSSNFQSMTFQPPPPQQSQPMNFHTVASHPMTYQGAPLFQQPRQMQVQSTGNFSNPPRRQLQWNQHRNRIRRRQESRGCTVTEVVQEIEQTEEQSQGQEVEIEEGVEQPTCSEVITLVGSSNPNNGIDKGEPETIGEYDEPGQIAESKLDEETTQ